MALLAADRARCAVVRAADPVVPDHHRPGADRCAVVRPAGRHAIMTPTPLSPTLLPSLPSLPAPPPPPPSLPPLLPRPQGRETGTRLHTPDPVPDHQQPADRGSWVAMRPTSTRSSPVTEHVRAGESSEWVRDSLRGHAGFLARRAPDHRIPAVEPAQRGSPLDRLSDHRIRRQLGPAGGSTQPAQPAGHRRHRGGQHASAADHRNPTAGPNASTSGPKASRPSGPAASARAV